MRPSSTLLTGGSSFQWRGEQVRLAVPGAHNVLDAPARSRRRVWRAPSAAGARRPRRPSTARAVASSCWGAAARGRSCTTIMHTTRRRSQATLEAARTLEHGRLVAVFQPHLYSRTRLLARDFGRALAQADAIAVLDVYPARERAEQHPGVSGLMIAEAAADAARGRPVYWLPDFDAAASVLGGLLGEGDVCLLMGAGDVDRLARTIAGRDSTGKGDEA